MPTPRSAAALPARDPLLTIERLLGPTFRHSLAADVREGLTRAQKSLPSKYFYDERGSQLFEAICRQPEYYLTRIDTRLLRSRARELVALAAPTDVIELGSGAARKTRFILDACQGARRSVRYVPMDVSETHLLETARGLRVEYPDIPVHGIAGDYERHLDHIPSGDRRLVLLLGSSLGNFPPAEADSFVRGVARRLSSRDVILIGMDLVKPADVLNAAYNDAAGHTAEFNRNVLRVVNRGVGGNFVAEEFEHLAFFHAEKSQIEMHLRATRNHAVRLAALDLEISFTAGETIHTEISRKFARRDAERMFAAADCRLAHWWTDEHEWFAEAVGVKI